MPGAWACCGGSRAPRAYSFICGFDALIPFVVAHSLMDGASVLIGVLLPLWNA